MARRRRYQPIARIRRVLLFALVLFGGAVGGYYLTGRLDVGGDQESAPATDSGMRVRDGLITVAQGFDYEVTDGEELAFRVKADRLVADIEDRMELDMVEIELPKEDGGLVNVVADRGTIHLDSNSATLVGSVKARESGGIELFGENFEVIRDGRQLVSKSPVTFRREGEFTGAASKLTYSIKKERLTLEGDVQIDGVATGDAAAGAIRCHSLTYDRVEGTVRLEGKVQISRGGEFLHADRLSLTFGEDGNDIRFVRAENGVNGRYLPKPSAGELASRVDFSGRLLYAAFEEGTRQAKEAELRGRAKQLASLDLVDESGLSRLVTAPVVLAGFKNGELATAEAQDSVVILERHAFAPALLLRRICSESAKVRFDSLGELQNLTLEGNVDYQAVDMQAAGDRIVARGAESSVAIIGRPSMVVTEQGDLQAPKITYFESGSVVAEQGVRAELRRGQGANLLGGDSEEPVRVTATTARWEQTPERVIFLGSVRAWQGRDYLLANEMVGEPEVDRLTATGAVKTVFSRESTKGQLGEQADDDGPITITSREMVYEQLTRVVSYDGDARAVQANRTLECHEMDVELDEQDEFERLVCTGDLLIEDPDQGKEVRGEVAIYVPAADEVDVTGDPVVLTDRDGTELKGGRIIYRFDTGGARIQSRSEPIRPAGGIN